MAGVQGPAHCVQVGVLLPVDGRGEDDAEIVVAGDAPELEHGPRRARIVGGVALVAAGVVPDPLLAKDPAALLLIGLRPTGQGQL